MNRFLTPLKVEKAGYDTEGRPLWRLLYDLVYESDRFGIRKVPAGFVTNFASVPRLPVVFLVAGGRAEEEATLHDYEYTVRQLQRAECDDLFYEALQADKPYDPKFKKPLPKWLAYVMYLGVHFGGSSAYRAETTVTQPPHVAGQINAADLVAA